MGELFVVVSAALNIIGWDLASAGLLHRVGYAVCLVVAIAAGGLLGGRGDLRLPKVRKRRWRRILPLTFGVILILSLVGGAIHLPSNYDALSYRTPQLLHWLDEGRWHWIDTPNSRMNIAPPGSNWLAAPLLLLTGTDRWTFLPNIAAFALFPGFLFEMLTRSGVRRRVASWWMWLVPAGYVFATQAGGLGNDMIGGLYATAALALALRANASGNVWDFGLSLIAVALCTGVKNVNLPILLPWLVAIWPAWRVVFRRPLAIVGFTAAAALSSCLPTTALNWKHTGHWTGDPTDEHRVRQPSAGSGLVSNAVVLLVANTQPPVWPATNTINELIGRLIKRSPLAEACRSSPRFEAKWYEMPSEEHAGLGPGILALGLISLVAACSRWRRSEPGRIYRHWDVAAAGCVALLVPISLMSTDGLPRLVAPLCIPVVLVALLPAANAGLTRLRLWRWTALLVALLPLPALLLSPARPLLPMRAALTKLAERHPESAALARAARVYRIYDERADAFLPLKRFVPENARTCLAGHLRR
jgi:hypothetical protein